MVNFTLLMAKFLNTLRQDKTISFLCSAILLDFVFTTLGLIVIGPKWESNQLYKSQWENGQYLLFIGTWVGVGVAVGISAFLIDGLKNHIGRGDYPIGYLFILNAVVIYYGMWTLYHGPIGWCIALTCNYVSSVNSCYGYTTSSPLFAILDFLFPIL